MVRGFMIWIFGGIISGFGYADMMYYLTELPLEVDELLYYVGSVIAFIGFFCLIYGLFAKKTIPPPPPPTAYYPTPTPSYSPIPAQQPSSQAQPSPFPSPIESGAPTVIREKETIREIVMIPCKYCGTLMSQTATSCPHCGANRAA